MQCLLCWLPGALGPERRMEKKQEQRLQGSGGETWLKTGLFNARVNAVLQSRQCRGGCAACLMLGTSVAFSGPQG